MGTIPRTGRGLSYHNGAGGKSLAERQGRGQVFQKSGSMMP
jgi:hypothetical protein